MLSNGVHQLAVMNVMNYYGQLERAARRDEPDRQVCEAARDLVTLPRKVGVSMVKLASKLFLFGGNAPYVEELYEAYRDDPASVPEPWREYFDALQNVPAPEGTEATDVAPGPIVESFAQRAKAIAFRPRTGGEGAARLKKRHFRLSELFERVASQYREHAAAKGLALRIAPTSAVIYDEPVLLELILSNLLSNAMRYTEEGAIWMGYRRAGRRQGGYIEMRDSGIGIPPVEQRRILAEMPGVKLQLRSAPGRGSVFRFPVQGGDPARIDTGESPGVPAGAHEVARYTSQLLGVSDIEGAVEFLARVFETVSEGHVPSAEAWNAIATPGSVPVAADPLAAARERGRRFAAEEYDRVDNLALLDARDYAARNERTINELRQKGELYALLPPGKTRGFRYPKWQFDADPERLRVVLRPFVDAGANCWVIHSFMQHRREALNGKSPAEVILDRTADIRPVIDLAVRELDGEQGAA